MPEPRGKTIFKLLLACAKGLSAGVGITAIPVAVMGVLNAQRISDRLTATVVSTAVAAMVACAFPRVWERVFWRPFEWLANAVLIPFAIWRPGSPLPLSLRIIASSAMGLAILVTVNFLFSGMVPLMIDLAQADLLVIPIEFVVRWAYVAACIVFVPRLCRYEFSGWIGCLAIAMATFMISACCAVSSAAMELARFFPDYPEGTTRALHVFVMLIAATTGWSLVRNREIYLNRSPGFAHCVETRESIFLWVRKNRRKFCAKCLFACVAVALLIFAVDEGMFRRVLDNESALSLRLRMRFAPRRRLSDEGLSPAAMDVAARSCLLSRDAVYGRYTYFDRFIKPRSGMKPGRESFLYSLCGAIADQDRESIEYFLKRNVDQPVSQPGSHLLFWFAIGANDMSMVRRLMDRGHSLHAVSGRRSLLQRSVMAGRLYWAKYLLKQGVDADTLEEDKPFLLRLAVRSGKLNMVKFCVNLGASPRDVDSTKASLIHTLAQGSCADVDEIESTLKYLLAAGLDINARDGAGHTPLDLVYDVEEMNKLFIRYGAWRSPQYMTDAEDQHLSDLCWDLRILGMPESLTDAEEEHLEGFLDDLEAFEEQNQPISSRIALEGS